MQPERTRASKRGTSVARARTFLKDRMGWLPGFPVSVPDEGADWLSAPPLGSERRDVRLDREVLHVATRCRSKLVRRFPRALGRAVPEVERWIPATERLLDLLKRRVHEGLPLPVSLMEEPGLWSAAQRQAAASLARAQPSLGPLLGAMSWARALESRAYDLDLVWLTENSAALSRLLECRPGPEGLRLALRLAELAREQKPGAATSLLEALAEPLAWSTPVEAVAAQVHWVSTGAKGEAPPAPALRPGPALLALTERLLLRDRRYRARALATLAFVDLAGVLGRWRAWWDELDRLTARLGRARRKGQDDAALRAALSAHVEKPPPVLALAALLPDVETLAEPDAKLSAPLLSLLQRVPAELEGGSLWAPLLSAWAKRHREDKGAAEAAARALDGALRRALARGEDAAALMKPWGHLAALWRSGRHRYHCDSDSDLLEEHPRRRWPALYDALLRCAPLSADPRGDSLFSWVSEQVSALGRVDGAVERVYAARWLELYPYEGLFRATEALAQSLSPTSEPTHLPPQWGALLSALSALSYEVREGLSRALGRGLSDAALRTLAGHLLRGEQAALEGLLRSLRMLASLKVPAPSPVEGAGPLPAWAEGYPEGLHPALAELSAAHPDPQRAAERLLRADLPRPEALETEIGALEARLAGAPDPEPLRQRLVSLRERLASPSPPSEARLGHLAEKLRRRAWETRSARWSAELQALVRGALSEALGAAAPRLQPAQREAVAAVFELEGAARRVGLELLEARAGAPPWDLRGRPENQAFLQRLRGQGVDTAPWLETDPVPAGSDPSLTLRFEDDPLEALRMGEHFDTCLSPSSFNFFSAVTNVVDVNKRVLYGRDPKGTVQARCLLALTEDGGLLCFHPYSHQAALGFPERVVAFARALAARMGVLVVPRGRVPTLVAAEWYDDGPRDLVDAFAPLAEGAPLRAALPGLEPAEALRRVEEAFAPLGLNAITLTFLLGLSELRDNPELGRAVLRRYARLRAPDAQGRDAALRLGLFLDDPELLRRVVAGWGAREALEGFEEGYLAQPLGEALVRCDPGALLRALRSTRPKKGARRLHEETDPGRLWWSAEALAAMGRPHQARAALLKMGGARPDFVRSEWVKARLARLEEVIGG